MRYSEQSDDMILDLEELRDERQYAHKYKHTLQLHSTGRDSKTKKLLLEQSLVILNILKIYI